MSKGRTHERGSKDSLWVDDEGEPGGGGRVGGELKFAVIPRGSCWWLRPVISFPHFAFDYGCRSTHTHTRTRAHIHTHTHTNQNTKPDTIHAPVRKGSDKGKFQGCPVRLDHTALAVRQHGEAAGRVVKGRGQKRRRLRLYHRSSSGSQRRAKRQNGIPKPILSLEFLDFLDGVG